MQAAWVDRGVAGSGGQAGQRLPIEDIEHGVANVEHDVAQRARRFVDARARFVIAERHTPERREGPVEQPDDSTDRDGIRIGGDRVAAVRAERGPDDTRVLEAGHDLLEKLARQAVALGQGGQRDRPLVAVADEVDQGAQAVFGATREAHRCILVPNA